MSDWLDQGPRRSGRIVVLAHGAGAGMDTPFMGQVAAGLVDHKLRVIRFEFPYMQRARAEGKRKPPDRLPKLQQAYRDVVAALPSNKQIIIGGKSMGGRVASTIADELGVAGLVCLGYPFHPPGRPEKLRTEHLKDLRTPTLIVQGSRDSFGNEAEVADYGLSSNIELRWLPDGDHSFKPRVKSGFTLEQHIDTCLGAVTDFAERLG